MDRSSAGEGDRGSPVPLEGAAPDGELREGAAELCRAADRWLGPRMPLPVWVSDARARAVFVNPAWRRLVGEPAARGPWHGVVHPEDRAPLERTLARALRAGRGFRAGFRLYDASGATRWMSGAGLALASEDGRFLGVACLCMDVTETLERFAARHATAPAPLPEPAEDEPAEEALTILFIDDERTVRDTAERILRRAGMRVLGAASGERGLELLEEHADRIALVLLDHTMPGGGGPAIFGRLRERAPELPILVVSGYEEEDVLAQFEPGAAQGVAGFVRKPFLPDTLVRSVRGALPEEVRLLFPAPPRRSTRRDPAG